MQLWKMAHLSMIFHAQLLVARWPPGQAPRSPSHEAGFLWRFFGGEMVVENDGKFGESWGKSWKIMENHGKWWKKNGWILHDFPPGFAPSKWISGKIRPHSSNQIQVVPDWSWLSWSIGQEVWNLWTMTNLGIINGENTYISYYIYIYRCIYIYIYTYIYIYPYLCWSQYLDYRWWTSIVASAMVFPKGPTVGPINITILIINEFVIIMTTIALC